MAKQKIDLKYVKKLKNGDRKAFDYIYNYYKDSIYYFALTLLRNEADAEETVQETFIKVIENINKLKNDASFHSWIFTIAFNHSLSIKNKGKRKMELSDDTNLEEIIEYKRTLTQEVSDNELKVAIEHAILEMPERFHQVAFLKYFDDLTVSEIAEVMQMPVGTVKSRLSKIRDSVQPILTEQGFNPAKYLTVAFTPMMYEAFQVLVNQNQMSVDTSKKIINSIVSSSTFPTVLAATAETFTISTGAKVAITFALVGGTGFVGYSQLNTQEKQVIKEIAYYDQLTNSDVEVLVTLSDVVETNKIEVFQENKSIDYTYADNQITFVAKSNGEYTVEIAKEKAVVTISNIDKKKPILQNASYEEGILSLDITDNSEIDYKNSYIKNNNENILIPEDHNLKIELDGTVEVVVVDIVGNLTQYEIEIN
ncbi:RNA polymerase sigma factor [Breznakia pachnodae]|uniref:RNA polymerase sigma factor (Sigma-70 family) n=1 Tax=Breznakia pachnodae TaxID=265178 RepID=A0ABU0DYR1_9FIRM|nr:RNA polymerase sigma factor [Breznakia pachnodae]MDQ0359770.1 RNA polymerase sigma factor (sigma-70 family) [Breznakia pachnodae]